jgi:hypothetical protein
LIRHQPEPRRKIAAWASAEAKARFSALAASRGLSESKLLGLIIDAVLARNPIDVGAEYQQRAKPGKSDHISVRLRPGDGTRLRERAHARGMKYTTYAAVLIRSHLFSNPPMPLGELSRLEGGLAQVSAIAGSLRQIAQALRQEEALDPELPTRLAAVLPAVDGLWQQMRQLVKANVLSWESDLGQAN